MAQVTLRGKNSTYVFDPKDPNSKVAEGGMGIVYWGINLDTGRKVAIKVVYRELARNPSNIARAEQEASVKIPHPNLLMNLDFIEQGGIYHIVSEFLDGRNLEEEIRLKGRLEEGRAIEIIKGVLLGLQALHAHQPPIFHRDIKPSNIYLCADGSVKVMDFGIAKISGGKRKSLTGIGTVVGTPHYSAPEQVKSEHHRISEVTDLYSTGITLLKRCLEVRPLMPRVSLVL